MAKMWISDLGRIYQTGSPSMCKSQADELPNYKDSRHFPANNQVVLFFLGGELFGPAKRWKHGLPAMSPNLPQVVHLVLASHPLLRRILPQSFIWEVWSPTVTGNDKHWSAISSGDFHGSLNHCDQFYSYSEVFWRCWCGPQFQEQGYMM